MASLVSSWSKHIQSLPAKYIMPPERRPGDIVSICKDIPVIDLGNASGHCRANLVDQIIKASNEFGLFQVINHGVSKEIMQNTMSLYKEFFDLAGEDKASFYSDDNNRRARLHTCDSNFTKEEVHYWRDTLRHPAFPLEDHMPFWPQKPARYREVVGTYSVEVRKLGLRILDLISEGLGLKEGYFGDKLSREQGMSINHYPQCPDPSLAMGIPGHHDPNLITMLQQEVYGLQLYKDEQWIGVDPIPSAFVINLCYQMEIISNGKLKSAEHRGVTNASTARTSIGTFFGPEHDNAIVIEPAKELVSVCNPPLFKFFIYKEFIGNYLEYIAKRTPHKEFLENYIDYLAKKTPHIGPSLGPNEIQA